MTRRILAPIVILGLGAAVVFFMVLTKPVVETRPIELPAPIVRVERAKPQTVQFKVDAQGTVTPRTQSSLVAQVAGEVVWTSPSLAPGGFFEAGQTLLQVDRVDYEAELESARAAVARTESEARRAGKDLARQRRLAGRSVASEARIDDSENADRVAQAGLREATARLGRAERDLERTQVRAPYAGRVRSESVDVGQYVQRGATLAEVYAVDYAEVRLPVPDRELRYLDLPLSYRLTGELGEEATEPLEDEISGDLAAAVNSASASGGKAGPLVELRAEFAGSEHAWSGRIVRTEGEIDSRSRMVTVVARVEDPYAPGREDGALRPPLAVGLFVSAEIAGISVPDAYVLPRSALHGDSDVFVVDGESRLRLRSVEVLRREREQIVVRDGLHEGDRVCISPMPGGVDGMKVEVQAEAAPLARNDV